MIDPFRTAVMEKTKGRFTVGVLASWQLYAGTIHTLLSPILKESMPPPVTRIATS
jgi:hypothetical protein